MDWLTAHFELARGNGPTIRPMEGLRGFAVLLVFLVHYVSAIEPLLAPASPMLELARALHTFGNTGVDLFFVLSGYLIYGSLIGRKQAVRSFLRRRVARIYPAFSVVFLLYLALSYALPAENKIPPGVAEGMLYLAQNFCLAAGFMQAPPMIAVAWSLSYEMLYYLSLPALIGGFGLRARSAPWRVGFFGALLLLAAAGFAAFGGPIRLLMFVAGILLHETIRAGRAAPGPGVALLALAATFVATLGSAMPVLKIGVLFGGFYVLCFSCFGRPRSWLARAIAFTPLRWLGNMSFSFYLLHGLALKAAFAALAALTPLVPGAQNGTLLFWTLLAPMLALSALPAAALFLLVERPLSLAPSQARIFNLARSGAGSSRP